MTANRFFIQKRLRESTSIYLGGHEHHHLSKVARIKPGDQVWLFDGSGNQYRSCVEEIGEKKTRLFVLERIQRKEPDVKITLGQVILKAKNMDLVVQKATELNTDVIVPVLSERTIVKIDGVQDKKRERWRRLAIEASKQCGRSTVPEIREPLSLRSLIEKNSASKKLFLSERGGTSLREILMNPLNKKIGIPKSVILLVGPEGGWTEIEEQDMMDSCYEAVSLGSHTLRSETAAIVSLALITHFWKNEDVS